MMACGEGGDGRWVVSSGLTLTSLVGKVNKEEACTDPM